MRHPKADDDRRRVFKARIEYYTQAGRPIVYLDESGFAKDSPRRHGYAPRGARCFGTQDWHARGRVNVLGALLAGVLLTVGLTDGNVDADMFNLWLEHDLMPKLPPHSVIVMDNAAFHKRTDTKDRIKNEGHTLEYLPPYSPDLNPIEHKWAQAKALRQKTGQNPEQIFKQKF